MIEESYEGSTPMSCGCKCSCGQNAAIPPPEKAFAMADKDGDGKLSKEDFVDFASTMHPTLGRPTVQKIADEVYAKFDDKIKDGDGKFGMEGFVQLKDAVHALL